MRYNIALVGLLAATLSAQAADEPASAVMTTTSMAASNVATPDVKVITTGVINFAADCNRKMYLEFLASQKLTDSIRGAMQSHGCILVNSRSEAEVIYELDGHFNAIRPATRRTAEVRVGEYAEKPEPLKTKSGRGPSLQFASNPIAMLISTITANVSNVSGAQDSVNSAFGDPDGICITRCERWDYKQSNVITLTRNEYGNPPNSVACKAEATAVALVPSMLIAGSLSCLSKQAGYELVSDFSLP